MGFFDKIKQGLAKSRDKLGGFVENVLSSFREVDEDLLEELEEALILSDVGVDTAAETIERLRADVKSGRLREVDEVKTVSRRFWRILSRTAAITTPPARRLGSSLTRTRPLSWWLASTASARRRQLGSLRIC